MTISSTTPFIAYGGDGSSTVYAIPFEFFSSTDLQVRKYPNYAGDPTVYQTLQIGIDYTVAGGKGSVGTLTLLQAPAPSETVTAQLSMPLEQPVDYPKHGTFPAEAHEQALDRLSLQIKQISYRLDNAEIGGGGGGAVLSFAGRTGTVVPAFSDYSSWFSVLGHAHSWSQITGKPTQFPPESHSHTWTQITGKPSTFFPSAHTHPWGEVTGKPGVFPPDTHNHTELDISDLDKYTRAEVDALIAAGGGGGGQYSLDDLTDVVALGPADAQVLTWVEAAQQWRPADPSGGGGVAGVSSFNGRAGAVSPGQADYAAFYRPIAYVPSWNEVTGKPTSFTPSAHTHVIADVTDLQTTLDGKAPTVHTHDWTTDITGKPAEFPPEGHTHPISDVVGLQSALDAKAPLDAPDFTGQPTIEGDWIATRSYVQIEVHKPGRAVSGDYTLVADDAGRSILQSTSGADRVLNVPTNATVPYAIGTRINVINYGQQTITLTPASGVDVYTKGAALLLGENLAAVTLEKVDVDTWIGIGDLS